MAELQLISSDAHVSEPPDFWGERLDATYRDRAPRVVLNLEGQVCFSYSPNSSSSALASCRSAVPNPSVNQP
jgi:hypothetical protein